ncbi:MAG: DEAD/DEAH box helicase [Actinomycetota bacterium]|nr:DEAD/DEAH box helicase [Actinomycetota bacterium]
MAEHAPQSRAPRSGPRTNTTASSKGAKKSGSWKNDAKDSGSWKGAKQSGSWKGAKKSGSSKGAKKSGSWKNGAQQSSSWKGTTSKSGEATATMDRNGAPGTDRAPRNDRAPRGPHVDWRDRQDRPAGASRADRTGRPDRPSRSGRPPHQGRSDRYERRGRNDRRDRSDRPMRAPQVPALTGPNAFVDLGVPTALAAVLASQAITDPTPIQAMTVPAALTGRDVLGRGRTGSGKTLSFGLPMLTILGGPREKRRQPRGLILAPTRELAMQVVDALQPLAATLGMRTQLIIGGSSYERQIRGLERADIVVATPGRLVDLAERGSVDLGAIKVVVLDEADHMADLGFMPEIEAIMSRLPDDAQGLLFSATLDHDVDRLVRRYLSDPVVHNADPATATVGTMEHHVVLVHPKDKDAVTADIAMRRGRTVAFVRTQLGADRLAGQLEVQGIRTAALHGGMKQGMRTRTLEDFRRGRIDVLVATDVAARGLHVDDIDLVLHVDPPHGPKEYLHRSGRTARAGASGTVISLATLRQQRSVTAITSKAGVTPAVLRVRPGDEALHALVS